jgi:hypothetical protein
MEVRRGREDGVVQPLPQAVAGGQRAECLGGQLGDRHVVGVAVPAVGAERDNGVRIELSHDAGDRRTQ